MTSSGPPTILLDGRSSIQLEFSVHGLKHWTGTLEATWEANISLVSDSQTGISVNAPKQVKVKFRKDGKNHTSAPFDIGEHTLGAVDDNFKATFGSRIDILTIIEGVHKSFSGVYQGLIPQHTQLILSNTVLTSKGDLFMQLLAKNAGQPAGSTNGVWSPVKTANESIRKRKEGTVVQYLQVRFTLTYTLISASNRPGIWAGNPVCATPCRNPNAPRAPDKPYSEPYPHNRNSHYEYPYSRTPYVRIHWRPHERLSRKWEWRC